ncbi:hypothetical protein RHRU231_480111 [Rhodococcus ruber]|uniref:Uncharacterized protein n=1 Tax=Rhodococcus ruber TaxID=1830 RepID=A0A098BLI8_9NOCA|nr:hypothetical protein RHRU231_480111 [Rhodococcus ruber]
MRAAGGRRRGRRGRDRVRSGAPPGRCAGSARSVRRDRGWRPRRSRPHRRLRGRGRATRRRGRAERGHDRSSPDSRPPESPPRPAPPPFFLRLSCSVRGRSDRGFGGGRGGVRRRPRRMHRGLCPNWKPGVGEVRQGSVSRTWHWGSVSGSLSGRGLAALAAVALRSLLRFRSQNVVQGLVSRFGKFFLVLGEVLLPRRRVPDLQMFDGTDHDAVLRESRVLAVGRGQGDPALRIGTLLVGSRRQAPKERAGLRITPRGRGGTLGQGGELVAREDGKAVVLTLRDHQPSRQFVSVLRGQREPPLVVQLGRVGTEEHSTPPATPRPDPVLRSTEEPLRRDPHYPTFPHVQPLTRPRAAPFSDRPQFTAGGAEWVTTTRPVPPRRGRLGPAARRRTRARENTLVASASTAAHRSRAPQWGAVGHGGEGAVGRGGGRRSGAVGAAGRPPPRREKPNGAPRLPGRAVHGNSREVLRATPARNADGSGPPSSC